MGDYSSARKNIPSYENVENAGIKLTKAWGETADLTLSYSVFSGRYKQRSSIIRIRNLMKLSRQS